MISVFNINGGNVVGKQDNFVGINLMDIFAWQIARTDKPGLNKARDESPVPVNGSRILTFLSDSLRLNSACKTSFTEWTIKSTISTACRLCPTGRPSSGKPP